MSVSLLSRPILSGCNWNAAGNPMVYKFQRFDHFMDDGGGTVINNSGGFARIKLDTSLGNATSYYEAGNSLYFKTDNGDYDAFSEVTSSSFDGTNTFIVTTTVFSTTGGTGGIVNNLSKRTDHRIEVECFYASGNTSITDGVKFTFSAARNGVITVNVSPIVKSVLSCDWENPSADNEAQTGASVKFYIKYQEYYDGALISSPTSDSGNPIIAVFAAMQIGYPYGSNMDKFFPEDDTKRWLTRFANPAGSVSVLHKLVMWRDWPFTLSFIWPTSIAGMLRLVQQYDAAGTLLSTAASALTAHVDDINRLSLPSINESCKSINLSLKSTAAPSSFTTFINASTFAGWTNEDAGQSWSIGGSDVITSDLLTQSKILSIADTSVPVATGKYFKLIFDLTLPNTKQVDIIFTGFNGTSWETLGTTLNVVGTGSPVQKTVTSSSFITPTDKAYTKYGIRINPDDAVLGDITIDNVLIQYGEPDLILSVMSIEVRDACEVTEDLELMHDQNPIHLVWTNSEGGDAHWNFEKYHEYNYTYESGKKAKRIILFERDLHPIQLEALEELNSIGEVYSVPLIDMENDDSVNKTAKRIGQQVYILSQDGETKTGVIVIPSSETHQSRNTTQLFSVEIELPEVIGME